MAGLGWRKSSFSNGASACVSVAFVRFPEDPAVLVRDDKDPDGPALAFTPAEWQAFLDGVQAGEFALPAGPQVGEMG